jgi:hypothetical protein
MSLELRSDGLRALWRRLPERSWRDAVAIWTQLLARAARDRTNTPDNKEDGDDDVR